MTLSIVTLNYKKPKLTIACLESLYKQYSLEFENDQFELLIVDNASDDDSVPVIRHEITQKKYRNVILIPSDENGGFGKGCNLGASRSKGKFILFLNNDTLAIDKGLTGMVKYMEEQANVAIMGGQLRNFDGSLQTSTGKFYTLGNAFLLILGLQKFGAVDSSPTEIRETDWVKGGLFMIRKDVFDNLHGFDEKIFMYTEDMELCYRAKDKGFKVYFYPFVKILHAEQGSSSRTFAIVNIYKNLPYFYKKHRSAFEYTILKSMLMLKALVLISFGKLTRNSYLITTYEQALKAI